MLKNKQFNIYGGFEKAPTIDDNAGIAYVEGWASKNYDSQGNPIVDYDGEIVKCEGFDLSRAKTLLYHHQHDEPIGTIELSHRPEGIWCKATVHKQMNEKAYYGVKNNIITGFSIGFVATDYEYTDIGNKSYVTFTKGHVLENSLVSVGANPEALITGVKGLVKDQTVKGLRMEIDKKELEQVQEIKSIQSIMKGLTFQESEDETWNQYDKLDYFLDILKDTIKDNFFEVLWNDNMTGEEVKQNMLDALTAFGDKLNELPMLTNPQNQDQGTNMDVSNIDNSDEGILVGKSKSAETETEVEATDVETTEEEVQPAQEGEETEVEATDVETTEETEDVNVDNVAEESEEQDEPEQDVTPVVEEPKKVTAQDTVGFLGTINYDELSAEEIEAIYNTASETLEKIEAYVKQDLEDEA